MKNLKVCWKSEGEVIILVKQGSLGGTSNVRTNVLFLRAYDLIGKLKLVWLGQSDIGSASYHAYVGSRICNSTINIQFFVHCQI